MPNRAPLVAVQNATKIIKMSTYINDQQEEFRGNADHHAEPSNENKMSDGHRERAWLAVEAY